MKIGDFGMSNVISMVPQRAQTAFEAVKEVEAYWEGLRNGRQIPTRAEIDPRGIQSALEYAFILERIAPRVARFRLAGMHFTDLLGMEVRGMPLSAMFSPNSRRLLGEAVEDVCTAPQVTTLTLASTKGLGRGLLQAQMILCPLKSDLGDVNRIFGCLQSNGKIGREPRRFDIEAVKSRSLSQAGTLDFAPPRTPNAIVGQSAPRPSGKPRLRLVRTED